MVCSTSHCKSEKNVDLHLNQPKIELLIFLSVLLIQHSMAQIIKSPASVSVCDLSYGHSSHSILTKLCTIVWNPKRTGFLPICQNQIQGPYEGYIRRTKLNQTGTFITIYKCHKLPQWGPKIDFYAHLRSERSHLVR